jgi:hypothetical protein
LRNGVSSPISRRAAVTGEVSWKHRVRAKGLRHLRALRQIHRRDRMNYVWVGMIKRLSALVNRVTSRPVRAFKWAVCRAYHGFGVPLPHPLRNSYILGVYGRAAQRYAVRTYPGCVSLFVPRDAAENPISDWKGLATGAIEIHEIPDGHEAILKEPHVQVWAEKLKACLNTAQV